VLLSTFAIIYGQDNKEDDQLKIIIPAIAYSFIVYFYMVICLCLHISSILNIRIFSIQIPQKPSY